MPESTSARAPRVRFLPWFRNKGQQPKARAEWFYVRNRADRRAARSHLTVLAQQTRNGTRPRTSPKMRHGIDDRPRTSRVLREARRLGLSDADLATLKQAAR